MVGFLDKFLEYAYDMLYVDDALEAIVYNGRNHDMQLLIDQYFTAFGLESECWN